jgi:hypothetical protein
MSARRGLRRVRRATYRLGSLLGDVDAITSGDPERMAKRFLIRKPLGRLFGRVMRRI